MKYLLILALSAMPVLSFAQDFVVRADKMNLVYIGIDNPLTIVSGDCGCDALSVSADKGTLKKVSGCKYMYTATESGVVNLEVATQKGGKRQVIGTQTLRAKFIADPKAVVGGRSGGYIALNRFQAQLGVSVLVPYCEVDLAPKVTRFTFKTVRKGAITGTADITGNTFAGECSQLMAALQPGDQVILEHIVCFGPDSVARSLGNLTFTMK